MENTNLMQVAINKNFNGIDFKGVVTYDSTEIYAKAFDFSEIKATTNGVEIPFEDVASKNVMYGDYSTFVTIRCALRFWVWYQLGMTEGLLQTEYPFGVFDEDDVVELYNGELAHSEIAHHFDLTDSYYLREDCNYVRIRRSDGYIREIFAPRQWYEEKPYCNECMCYIIDEDNYNYDRGRCSWCARHIIEGYTESHRHNENPVFFGKYKGEFAGLGFELEVDSTEPVEEEDCVDTAEGLCEACGLEENEMRFAHDGSLRYGFEIISEPHTVQDFWQKTEKWQKMLKYLLSKGFRSHDPNTCGLHIHISRAFFGSTGEEQDKAIAKIYSFFDDNWKDLVKVSRRTVFEFCDKNSLDYYDYDKIRCGRSTKYKEWKKKSKNSGSHYVALNNRNRHTFEYRLGRGTLNAWSFFSWIDLIVTISKNAKRITVGKVTSNDLVSWLGGITESTARYIYKRGAFRDAVLALYPSIEWSADTSDSSSDND